MGLFSFLKATPEKYENKGDLQFNKKNYGTAKLEYENALACLQKKQPENSDYKKKLAEKLNSSKHMLALENIETADGMNDAGMGDEAKHLYKLALSLLSDDELKTEIKSKIDKIESEQFEPEDVETNVVSEETYVSSGTPEEDLNMILATLPDETEKKYRSFGANFLDGYLKLNYGDFQAAAELLEKALEENPDDNSMIHIELANAYINMGQSDEAESLLEESFESNRDSLQAFMLLYDLYLEKLNLDKAAILFEKCDASIANTVSVLLLKGNLHLNEKEWTKAESVFNEIINQNDWNFFAAKGLADVLFYSENFKDAMPAYGKLMDYLLTRHSHIDADIRENYAISSVMTGNVSEKTHSIFLSLAAEDPENKEKHLQNAKKVNEMMA